MEAYLEKFEKFPIQYKIVILGVLLVAMYYWFQTNVQEPFDAQIRTVQGNINKAKTEYDDIHYKIQHLTEVEQEIRKLRNQLTEAVSLLPVKTEVPSLLKKVATLAEKSGLTIVKFKPMAEINRRYYFEVPVMLELKGSFHEVANFFDQVGKMRRVVNISGILMQRPDCGLDGFSACKDPNPTLKIECRAMTYRFAASELTK